MSLIQDALKRKSEELPPVQPVVPGTQPTSAEEAAMPKGPQSVLVLLIILLIIALLVALGGLAFSLIHSGKKNKEQTPAAMVPAVEIPAEVPVAPVVTAPQAEALEPAAAPAPVTAPVVEPVVIEQPVVEPWPELTLTGIASSGNQRIAIINGKMITAGRIIGEVLVREVRDDQAIVEFRGERRILHVNE
jgi:hypothetical protein